MRRITAFLRSAIFLSFVCGATCSVARAESTKDIQNAIEKELAQQVLTLRGFYRDEELRFDLQGAVMRGGAAGYNGSDGGMEIRKVEIKPNAVILSGNLPVIFFDQNTGSIHYRHGLVTRRVEIALLPTVSQETVMNQLWKVFFKPNEQLGDCPADEATRMQSSMSPRTPTAGNSTAFLLGRRACDPKLPAVLHVGGSVTAPRALATPDPVYTQKAKGDRVQGTVLLNLLLSPDGHPESIVIMRALGDGLDEEAARTVHTWKFDPAKRDGNPVAVVIMIEVNFHLY